MRILITGGNGYVGRELVRLLRDEHELCVVDSLRYGSVRFGAAELARLRLEMADIGDLPAIRAVMASFEPQAVIHLAAIHYIPECEETPLSAIRTNVLGTVNLLESCPPGARFVLASSGAVYAPAPEPHDEEAAATGPTDIYGHTKLQAEAYVRHLVRKRGLQGVSVRLFNVIGPGETNPHLVPEIVAQLKSGRRTIRLGNLWPRRDYIHVRDAARGFAAAALRASIPPGETLTVNLGTSRAYSVSDILRKLRPIAGVAFEVEHDETRARAEDRPHLAAAIGRIRRLFGWEPELSIDDALADLWANPDLAERLTSRYPAAALPVAARSRARPQEQAASGTAAISG